MRLSLQDTCRRHAPRRVATQGPDEVCSAQGRKAERETFLARSPILGRQPADNGRVPDGHPVRLRGLAAHADRLLGGKRAAEAVNLQLTLFIPCVIGAELFVEFRARRAEPGMARIGGRCRWMAGPPSRRDHGRYSNSAGCLYRSSIVLSLVK